MSEITGTDLVVLTEAREALENPSLAIRLSSAVGMPVEAVAKSISARAPKSVSDAVSASTKKAIETVMLRAAETLRDEQDVDASPRLHAAAAATTGAVAGFVGIKALAVELPITTGIMFRSIVDIARAEGESPRDDETLINAMQVFAFGSGISSKDDAAETSYYGARLALSQSVSEAMQYVARHGIGDATAPVLVRFVAMVAKRFGIVVTQKAMAQTLPVVGAVGGGLINTIFISHFQDVARSHFAIRRLEREYGADAVRLAYEEQQSARSQQ